jgi:predicted component of type VI protein secretion system
MYLSINQSSNYSGWSVHTCDKTLIDYGVIDLSKLPKSTAQDQTVKRQVLIKFIKE